MRILDRYISRQIITGTAFTVIVLSLVLVLGNLFKEIRPLLVDQRAPLSIVFRFVLNILPFSLMFTIPWGFLAAILLVFGRLSSDNELHGFRFAGIGLARLSAPVFLIGLALSGLCLWLNVSVAPRARASLGDMLFDIAKRDPRSLLDPGVVQGRFRNQKVFVERKVGDELHGFHLYQLGDKASPGGPQAAYVHAGRVALVFDKQKQELQLTLNDTFIETRKADGTIEMAFAGEAEPYLLDLTTANFRKARAATMDNREIREILASGTLPNERVRNDFRSEITRRYTFSMACFALAFVGVPLGITARRRDTAGGMVISLMIGAGYFLFSLLAGQSHGSSPLVGGSLLWLPNIVCIGLGLWFFRRCRFR